MQLRWAQRAAPTGRRYRLRWRARTNDESAREPNLSAGNRGSAPSPGLPNVVDEAGEVIGTLLLWLDDHGYIDRLEYAWVTGGIPTELPRLEAIVSTS